MKAKNSIWFCVLPLLFFTGCSDDPAPTDPQIPESQNQTIRVPADQPTIQAAVDLAESFDIILVADGIYTGEGNRDIDLSGRALTLRSENGPQYTILDLEGTGTEYHRAFICQTRTDNTLVIDGFTLTGGQHSSGGALWLRSSSPTIRNCIFADNVADLSGGAVRCKSSDPVFQNCTFVGNRSMVGGTLFCIAGSEPRFENCIIAFGQDGGSVENSSNDDKPLVACSNIFGNAGGDWTESIDSLATENNNLEIDPLFCNAAAGDYQIQASSPCTPDSNACSVLIGALGSNDCQ
jgi:hypothetical protein